MIEVFDSVLSDEEFQDLSKDILHENFIWRWQGYTVDYGTKDSDVPQFVHVFQAKNLPDTASEDILMPDERIFKVVENVIRRSKHNIEIEEYLRCKSNLLIPGPSPTAFHPPHTDTNGEGRFFSIVFYVTENPEAPTYLFTGDMKIETVPAIPNRAVLFNSHMRHSSSSPAHERRVVLNFVFKVKEE